MGRTADLNEKTNARFQIDSDHGSALEFSAPSSPPFCQQKFILLNLQEFPDFSNQEVKFILNIDLTPIFWKDENPAGYCPAGSQRSSLTL
ncbi:MAG: hypothetical protein COV66_01155 [Nitrospinae bacterium CG11_big_fil_rev_8_21_14_0_20_45_15]|nr:MAG: hypothetical protein COV66_01155 [Nitrospinae bacterium CG11_big_fil_rev_8_21_14_0_20_45_15]